MRIGIVEAGRLGGPLRSRHGDFPPMFERLLKDAEPRFTFRSVAVLDGELPGGPGGCDGWLLTGSAHAVYEDHAWIRPLEAFCRDCADRGRPLVGVCFGHQLIAQAFGGTVEKSARGWGAGVHTYRVHGRRPWMVEPHAEISAIVSHQDQITVLPEGAEIVAGSEFCPNAVMTLGEQVLTMQCHPEMSAALSVDIIDARCEQMGDAVAGAARSSLANPVDHAVLAGWMAAFFKAAG